jgi:hypothetical protein
MYCGRIGPSTKLLLSRSHPLFPSQEDRRDDDQNNDASHRDDPIRGSDLGNTFRLGCCSCLRECGRSGKIALQSGLTRIREPRAQQGQAQTYSHYQCATHKRFHSI